jgi:midasin
MTFASPLHDPLAINLRRQTSCLLSSIAPSTPHYDALNIVVTTRQLLSNLSSLLAVPAFTQLVATYFRPILMELCVRWLEGEYGMEEHLFALSYLVEVHEELFPYVTSHFLLRFLFYTSFQHTERIFV